LAPQAIFHAINAVLVPGKSPTAGRRHLLQHGGGARGANQGGEQADAVSMALQANYDAQQEDIAWAATSGTPGAAEDVTEQANIGNQLVALPGVDEAEW
jgi:hypothetical protein